MKVPKGYKGPELGIYLLGPGELQVVAFDTRKREIGSTWSKGDVLSLTLSTLAQRAHDKLPTGVRVTGHDKAEAARIKGELEAVLAARRGAI